LLLHLEPLGLGAVSGRWPSLRAPVRRRGRWARVCAPPGYSDLHLASSQPSRPFPPTLLPRLVASARRCEAHCCPRRRCGGRTFYSARERPDGCRGWPALRTDSRSALRLPLSASCHAPFLPVGGA